MGSVEWGDVTYKQNQYKELDFTLNASSFTVSGFSSGAFLSSNLMAMFNDHLNGAGIFSGGGPCAEPSNDPDAKFCDELKPEDKGYPTIGYKDKPMYHYHGFEDSTVKIEDGMKNSEWSVT